MRISRPASLAALWLQTVAASPAETQAQTKCRALAGSSKVTSVDVAIIGGGSAGVHVAVQLKDAGASVLVIEKKDQIGGHAETYVDPETGASNNVGVVVFSDTDPVNRYFARLGVPTIRANPFLGTGSSGVSVTYDFALGIFVPPLDDAGQQQQQQAIQAAAQSYADNVLSRYGWVDQGYFLPDPVPDELAMPFADFAAKYNFSAMLPLMSQFAWYFGNQTQVPALYGVKDFGPGLLRSTFGNFVLPASGDTRSVYDAALAALGSSVRLNSTVLAANRSSGGGGVRLLVSQRRAGGSAAAAPPETVCARKLVVAIPPVLLLPGADSSSSLDLTRDERALFSKFTYLGYFTGQARVPGWASRALVNVGALTPFHQPLIPGSNGYRAATDAPDDFLFGVGFDAADAARVTEAEAEAVVRRELATLAAAGAVPAGAADAVTFPATSFHRPFNQRVAPADIRAGFYARLLALQGVRDTYWTGAAWAGQNSALIWAYNEGTVVPALKRDLGLA